MNVFFIIKLIHILGAITLIGTGFGIFFFMLMSSFSKNVTHIFYTAKTVVIADWLFTTPAVVIQFITGIWLMNYLHYSFTSVWFLWVIALFVLIGCCWLPVVLIQYRLKKLAEQAHFANTELSPHFYKLMRLWTSLGIPAFGMIILMTWLMVFKPFAMV